MKIEFATSNALKYGDIIAAESPKSLDEDTLIISICDWIKILVRGVVAGTLCSEH